jgi:hypothetical protein
MAFPSMAANLGFQHAQGKNKVYTILPALFEMFPPTSMLGLRTNLNWSYV